jgi:hypothetical protein
MLSDFFLASWGPWKIFSYLTEVLRSTVPGIALVVWLLFFVLFLLLLLRVTRRTTTVCFFPFEYNRRLPSYGDCSSFSRTTRYPSIYP